MARKKLPLPFPLSSSSTPGVEQVTQSTVMTVLRYVVFYPAEQHRAHASEREMPSAGLIRHRTAFEITTSESNQPYHKPMKPHSSYMAESFRRIPRSSPVEACPHYTILVSTIFHVRGNPDTKVRNLDLASLCMIKISRGHTNGDASCIISEASMDSVALA